MKRAVLRGLLPPRPGYPTGSGLAALRDASEAFENSFPPQGRLGPSLPRSRVQLQEPCSQPSVPPSPGPPATERAKQERTFTVAER